VEKSCDGSKNACPIRFRRLRGCAAAKMLPESFILILTPRRQDFNMAWMESQATKQNNFAPLRLCVRIKP
jgi:hypothetical protein